jgi:hypothetical protein
MFLGNFHDLKSGLQVLKGKYLNNFKKINEQKNNMSGFYKKCKKLNYSNKLRITKNQI